MSAALFVVPATSNPFSVPFLATLAIAIVVLAAIAVYLRRLRVTSRLTARTVAAGGASAALVLAGALLVTLAISAPTPAVATPSGPPATQQEAPGVQPPISEDLDGYQLPTK